MVAAGIHIFGATDYNTTSIRATCPICETKRYGFLVLYYDGWRVSLSCGFYVPAEGHIRGHYGVRGGHAIYRRNFDPNKYGWTIWKWMKRVPVKPW